jgi:hypothetical protein
MPTPEEPLMKILTRCRRVKPEKSRSRHWLIFAIIILTLTSALDAATPGEKTEELYFSGRLIELNAAKHTFTIRSKNKELVFAIDPRRCDITVDGSISERTLRWARVGDAVMGEVSLKEAKPYVTWVEFTHKPERGKPIPGKPGFILSPYMPRWPDPWHRPLPLDAQRLAHGDMVLDEITGKIFVVP